MGMRLDGGGVESVNSGISCYYTKTTGGGKFPQPVKGKSRDKAAKATGKSARTLKKAKAVRDAARAEPERFGKLTAYMNRTGGWMARSTRSM